jgi:hypothetical protein
MALRQPWLSGGALFVEDGAGDDRALAAFRLPTKRAKGLAGRPASVAGASADLIFPDGIAHADDHAILRSMCLR